MNKSIYKLTIQSSFVSFKRLVTVFSIFFILLWPSQAVYADTGITIKKGKVAKIPVYSAPSSASKTKTIIKEGDVVGASVIKDAMNGRFLQIDNDNKKQWIKARHVITSQIYDVGACEAHNKSTGTRAAVNCTE